ncbi:PA14 domain-containing protein [Streptomyces sp. NPDC056144]|uniref:PA14 domain-containing protein n=1 Tax=unclassified Streptomyces TaxID=2593676 RepID=UPI0035E22182
MRRSLGTARRRTAGAAVLSLATVLTGLAFPATAQAATTCAAGVWKAEYYANTTLTGTPKGTVCDTAIAENYGLGDPAGVTLPKDNFGVRWSTTRNFGSGGPFDLKVAVQDGARVYLDGVRKIDLWRNVSTNQNKTVRLTVPRGTHTLRVDFAAFTGTANVSFTYAPVIGATLDRVAPLAPTGLKTVYSAATQKTTVTWSKNAEMDLAGYRVWRRTGPTGTWVRLNAATLTGTTYTDAPPATGAKYEYVLRALDRSGNSSPLSAVSGVTSADKTPPGVPTGLRALVDPYGAGARIYWSAVSGASAYEVQRSLRPTDGYATVGPLVTGYEMTDPSVLPATTYYYRVRARDAAANTSAYSAAIQLAVPETRPLAPTGVSASGTLEGNTVGWTYTADDTHRFHVYAAASASGPWTRLTETPAPNAFYEDATAVPGELRYYHVRTVTPLGTESHPSTTVSAIRVRDTTPPPAPYGLHAYSSTDGVRLDWTPNTGDDTNHYVVMRKQSYEGWEQIANVWGATSTFYLDTSGQEGVSYGYTVLAVDEVGNTSRLPEPGYNTVYGKRTPVYAPPAAPASLTATLTENGKVSLEWAASTATDVDHYYVYRVQAEDPNPDNATAVSTALSPSTTTFTDESVTAGRSWAYYVRAISTHNVRSEASPRAEVTVPCPTTTAPAKPRLTGGDYYEGNVRLVWETGTCDQGNTVSYNVYRSRDGRPFAPANLVATGLTEPNFSDPDLAPAYYYYVVTAVSADGTESAPTGVFTVSVPYPSS